MKQAGFYMIYVEGEIALHTSTIHSKVHRKRLIVWPEQPVKRFLFFLPLLHAKKRS